MSLNPPSQDWMVLQCRSCGTRMKSRRDLAPESRLLCPKCHTPVPLQEEESKSGGVEFRADPLPERQLSTPPTSRGPELGGGGVLPGRKHSAVFEGGLVSPDAPAQPRDLPPEVRGEHPEFDGNSPADDFAYDPAHAQGERRRRIKKRRTRRAAKTYVELTDWNQSDLDDIPDAEITADIWGEVRPLPEDVYLSEENEYVVEAEAGDDGQTRLTKKKVRRKRLLAGTRLFFKRFTGFSRYFIIGLGLLVAGVAVYGGTIIIGKKKYVPPPLPPVVAEPLDRRVLTEYDTQGAEKAVRDFLAADGVEAKLPFVRQPKRVKPLMEKWYKTHPSGPMEAGKVEMQDKKGGDIGSTGYFVLLAMPVLVPDPLNAGSTREEMTFFSVEEIRKGPTSTYLVDWETSTGYQEMPLDTYKSTMPVEYHPFRIFMKSGDYYNHGFEEHDWQCVELYYPGRDFHLWGYVSRKSLDGRALLIQLANGWSGPVIAELQYPEHPVSRDQVIVRRMVHQSWYYADGEEIEK